MKYSGKTPQDKFQEAFNITPKSNNDLRSKIQQKPKQSKEVDLRAILNSALKTKGTPRTKGTKTQLLQKALKDSLGSSKRSPSLKRRHIANSSKHIWTKDSGEPDNVRISNKTVVKGMRSDAIILQQRKPAKRLEPQKNIHINRRLLNAQLKPALSRIQEKKNLQIQIRNEQAVIKPLKSITIANDRQTVQHLICLDDQIQSEIAELQGKQAGDLSGRGSGVDGFKMIPHKTAMTLDGKFSKFVVS